MSKVSVIGANAGEHGRERVNGDRAGNDQHTACGLCASPGRHTVDEEVGVEHDECGCGLQVVRLVFGVPRGDGRDVDRLTSAACAAGNEAVGPIGTLAPFAALGSKRDSLPLPRR